jgi:hypothetical protein
MHLVHGQKQTMYQPPPSHGQAGQTSPSEESSMTKAEPSVGFFSPLKGSVVFIAVSQNTLE